MTVRTLTWAWEQSLPANEKLVLLCLADHAGGTDWHAYPGQREICRARAAPAADVLVLIYCEKVSAAYHKPKTSTETAACGGCTSPLRRWGRNGRGAAMTPGERALRLKPAPVVHTKPRVTPGRDARRWRFAGRPAGCRMGARP